MRVTGRYRDAPLLEFIGRADAVSDLVGEKLADSFVADALQRVAHSDAFCTLLPLPAPVGPATYYVLTDDANPVLAQALENELQKAFRYREARWLGQLASVTAISHPRMRNWVHEAIEATGVKSGDIKDRALITRPELARQIYGHVVARYRDAT